MNAPYNGQMDMFAQGETAEEEAPSLLKGIEEVEHDYTLVDKKAERKKLIDDLMRALGKRAAPRHTNSRDTPIRDDDLAILDETITFIAREGRDAALAQDKGGRG